MVFHKLCKLTVHEPSFSHDDVIIYKEDAGLKVGDIIEVYHPDGNYSRLLVQIKQFPNHDIKHTGEISIHSSLASSFHLRHYSNVVVNHISDVNTVTLDVLELVFKDQFVTRSDMWRLHRSLIGTCVYFCTKVTFTKVMRVHVSEMWMKGSKVACGVVGESTKIVCQSLSAKFHIFVQMSAEMWEFDHSGDLYFEKAIMGFLQDLFSRWKSNPVLTCNHNVVIVLFSRTYYRAQSIDKLPRDLQKEVLCSCDGRYYCDFYKIIRQSEKQDNLQNVILDLKSSFHGYPLYVGCQQPLSDDKQAGNVNPKGIGTNSRAAQGNLLEAINLSLNVFEKLYIDCSLEETNCTTLVITPGTGVFEVDKELTNLTRNRLIDNGVRVDLVCLAEQPLHAVPLLKFITSKHGNEEIYNVPQWLNLSYYAKPNSHASSVFVPRMQVPEGPSDKDLILERSTPVNSGVIDFNEFDAKVFDYSKPRKDNSLSRGGLSRHTTIFDKGGSCNSSPEVSKSVSNAMVKKHSYNEEPNFHLMRSISEDQGRRALHGSYDDLKFTMATEKDNTPTLSIEQLYSSDNGSKRQKSVFNPFKPQHMATKITLFKYRWLDVMDLRLKSVTEHYEMLPSLVVEPVAKSPSPEVEAGALAAVAEHRNNLLTDGALLSISVNGQPILHQESKSHKNSLQSNDSISLHNDHSATILTRVDWKSLCMPACLPLTINYFPDDNVLSKSYIEYHYTMIMEDLLDIGTDKDQGRQRKEIVGFDRSSMSPDEKFMEMISQRIGQGFQFVTKSDIDKLLKLENCSLQSMQFDPKRDYVLSMGHIIHVLKLVDTQVHVTRYSFREPYVPKPFTYRYNVWPHNRREYSLSQTEFSYELAAQYNWNNLDRYICETEFNQLNEQMKYWRARFLLLPIRSKPFSTSPPIYDSMQQIEAFMKFLEGMNKIKRGVLKRHLFRTRRKAHSAYGERLKPERSATPDRLDKRENVNSDKKTPPTRLESQDGKDIDSQVTPRSSSFSGGIPDDMPPEHCLSIKSPLQDIIKAMLNPKYGLHFLPQQAELHENTFISAEAVAWMIKSIDITKSEAVQLGQRLLEEKCIIHASESVRQSFMDGFFLYYIKKERKEEEPEKRRFWFGSKESEEELLKSYNIQWLEAAIWRNKDEFISFSFLEDDVSNPDILTMVQDPPYTALLKDDIENTPTYKYNPVPLFKSMEYNLEADQKSNRSEWCTLYYHGNYYPNKCAYSIELNWMVATCSIIADLVQKWSHKGISCGVHLVPSPMIVFPSGNNAKWHRNPLRGSPFIHLSIECLLKGKSHLFEEYDPSTWSTRMFLFQEAILRRFDFLRDIPRTAPLYSKHNSREYQYIHSSGSIMMKINNSSFVKDSKDPSFISDEFFDSPFRKGRRHSKKLIDNSKNDIIFEDEQYKDVHGFFWVYNWQLTKKWRSSYTGDVANAKKFVAIISDFCSNKDDQLVNFWEDACDSIL